MTLCHILYIAKGLGKYMLIYIFLKQIYLTHRQNHNRYYKPVKSRTGNNGNWGIAVLSPNLQNWKLNTRCSVVLTQHLNSMLCILNSAYRLVCEPRTFHYSKNWIIVETKNIHSLVSFFVYSHVYEFTCPYVCMAMMTSLFKYRIQRLALWNPFLLCLCLCLSLSILDFLLSK